MKFSYVLPDPHAYPTWSAFEADLASLKEAGYEAVELQIADPNQLDEGRLRESLAAVDYIMCAFQTGSSYSSHGNCLSTADDTVRERTIRLLKDYIDLAYRWQSVIVFGSLQGRLADEPDRTVGEARILQAIQEVGQYATERGVTFAYEPVNHLEVGFNNTIAEVVELITRLDLPAVRLMIDTFHMNIEEQAMLAPLPSIRPLLAHVHLSETNRDVLGTGHWDTGAFLEALHQIGYEGYCSVGVYNTRLSRRECITRCMAEIKKLMA